MVTEGGKNKNRLVEPKELITSLREKLSEGLFENQFLEYHPKAVLEEVWIILLDKLNKKGDPKTFSETHLKASKILLDYWLNKAEKVLGLSESMETSVKIFDGIEDEENMRVFHIETNSSEEISKVDIAFSIEGENSRTSFSADLFPIPTTMKCDFSVDRDSGSLRYELLFIGDKISTMIRTRSYHNLVEYSSAKKIETLDFGTHFFTPKADA